MMMQFILSTRYLGKLACTANRFYSSNAQPLKTVFYDFHLANKGKMVEFAGYSMPIQYESQSIIDSHNFVRSSCGLFDVSHMLQLRVCGQHRQTFMETLTVADIEGLKENQGTLSLYTNPQGGIMDDVIITKCQEPHYYVVSNAGCVDKIKPHLESWISKFQKQGRDVRLEYIDNGLLALQGPKMVSVLQPGLPFPLETLKFMHGQYTTVFGIPGCRVTRCGYTGEDGVEISVPKARAVELAQQLVQSPDVKLIGLGARDTLRLEAGLCLYGNDIDENTTPVEAVLLWTVGKNRRDETGTKFLGFDKIMGQVNKKIPVEKKRVGFLSDGGPPARAGAKILDKSGSEIGRVTSGCLSPYLKLNVAMGYVPPAHAKSGTEVQFEIRGKAFPGKVVKMPVVPSNYYTPK